MDPADYLQRIGDNGPLEPNVDVLARLHRAHMRTVPFENLDIALGTPIELDVTRLYDKIVGRRRGGFCYELNGLFGWLLDQLGYATRMLSARVYDDDGPGPDFDHMLLLVDLGDEWIADVGFGDSFIEPLPLAPGEHAQAGADYRLREDGEHWVLDQRRPDEGWAPQYRFTLTPRRLEEYAPMCRFQQTSPESGFTRRSVCSRSTAAGRVTFANGRLIETRHGRKEERPVPDADACRALLAERFGVALDADAPVEQLLRPARPAPSKTDAAMDGQGAEQ